MERLSLAFLALLHQVSVGSLIPLLFLRGVGKRGFLKVVAFTCLSLEGIALGIQFLALRPCSVSEVGCWMFDTGVLFVLLLAAFTAFLFLKDERKSSLFLRLALFGGAVNLFFAALPFHPGLHFPGAIALLILSFLSSALFLGSVVVAMLLGHWYLVEPGLSIRPLKRLTALYVGSGLFQGFIVLVTTLFALLGGPASKMALVEHQYTLIGRIGLGIFLPLGVGALAWETLKIPHTQAATGLLYVAILLVVAGELLGRYLLAFSFIPL